MTVLFDHQRFRSLFLLNMEQLPLRVWILIGTDRGVFVPVRQRENCRIHDRSRCTDRKRSFSDHYPDVHRRIAGIHCRRNQDDNVCRAGASVVTTFRSRKSTEVFMTAGRKQDHPESNVYFYAVPFAFPFRQHDHRKRLKISSFSTRCLKVFPRSQRSGFHRHYTGTGCRFPIFCLHF